MDRKLRKGCNIMDLTTVKSIYRNTAAYAKPVVLVLKEIGILLLMAVVLITISIRKFKYRLE